MLVSIGNVRSTTRLNFSGTACCANAVDTVPRARASKPNVRAFIIVDLLASSSEISTKGHLGISQSLRKAQRNANFAKPNAYERACEVTEAPLRINNARSCWAVQRLSHYREKNCV